MDDRDDRRSSVGDRGASRGDREDRGRSRGDRGDRGGPREDGDDRRSPMGDRESSRGGRGGFGSSSGGPGFMREFEEHNPEGGLAIRRCTALALNEVSSRNLAYCVNDIRAELCALVNKPSGASAGASDLKY